MIFFQQYTLGGTHGPSSEKYRFYFTKIRGQLPNQFDVNSDTEIFEEL